MCNTNKHNKTNKRNKTEDRATIIKLTKNIEICWTKKWNL